tara:strand:- start:152 stop:367 length:216 start_codon:yes stop_codon:yes gene_type:complete
MELQLQVLLVLIGERANPCQVLALVLLLQPNPQQVEAEQANPILAVPPEHLQQVVLQALVAFQVEQEVLQA